MATPIGWKFNHDMGGYIQGTYGQILPTKQNWTHVELNNNIFLKWMWVSLWKLRKAILEKNLPNFFLYKVHHLTHAYKEDPNRIDFKDQGLLKALKIKSRGHAWKFHVYSLILFKCYLEVRFLEVCECEAFIFIN